MFNKTKKLFLCIIIFCANFSYASYLDYLYPKQEPSANSFGHIGLIQIPSAETRSEGSIFFTFTSNDIYKFGSLVVTPFNWLEASYFYYRPSDLAWTGPGTEGLYLDKGFTLKFSKSFDNLGSLAIGLNDFAGTGFFSGEYLAFTQKKESFKYTLGIGWGIYADDFNIKNPLSLINDDFNRRPGALETSNYGVGGSPSFDTWFRGSSAIIGGVEIFTRLPGVTIKIERDPFDYIDGFSSKSRASADRALRKKDSDYNFGLSYEIFDGLDLGISWIKGNTLNLSVSFGADFSKNIVPKKKNNLNVVSSGKGQSKKMRFYEDLLANLNSREIFIQSIDLDEHNQVNIAYSSGKYRNSLLAFSIIEEVAHKISKSHNIKLVSIEASSINVGTELHAAKRNADVFKYKQYKDLLITSTELSRDKAKPFGQNEFQPIVKFPSFFYGMTPVIDSHIGDPRKFYYGGLSLLFDSEIQLSRKAMINSMLKHSVFNNFGEKINNPDSKLPHVRTDIVRYLQESDTYIENLKIDYFTKISKNIYGKVSLGILESMYSGGGVEFLHKPFESNLATSFNLFKVKKREFDRGFDLRDYSTVTGHLTFDYHLNSFDFNAKLSIGRYLAKDDGYTVELYRQLPSGFRAGAFFTRTNVSKELFGEGSFDKGFYFYIPIDLFLNEHRGGNIHFRLTPLTRDGGQKLILNEDLNGVIHSSSMLELERMFYD